MFQSLGWFAKTLALVMGLTVMTSDICNARPGGGRGGFGGGRGYSAGRGYYGGGYGRGYYGGGYGGWGWGGVGAGLALGLGYPYYSGYYGYPGYYGGYSYPSGYNYSYPTYGYSTVVPQAFSTMSTAAVQPAHITVQVPDPNAKVFFDGAPTNTTGSVRVFDTPPLQQGDYTYDVTASWTENGKPMTKTQTVHVAPGAAAIVNFQQS